MHKKNALIKKYKNLSVPLKATIWFMACSFLQRGVNMITTPVFTRLLPTEEYGLYSTYLSWENVLLMVVSLCLYKSIMNLYIKYDDQEMVLSTICGLELLLSGIWFFFGLVFRKQLSGLLKIPVSLVCCLFINNIFQATFQCWSLYKRYKYEYKTLAIITIIMTAGSSLMSVLAVVLIEHTAAARAIGTVCVVSIVGSYLLISIFKKSNTVYNSRVWIFALSFCIPLLPHYLSEFILQSSDKIMINYMCNASDVAIYSIAYSVGSIINLITTSINSTFAPYQYQKIQSGEYDKLAKKANQVLLFVGVMLSGIMIFSREIVLIFGGYKYNESVGIIIPICLGVYFNYMFELFARVQEYYERKLTVVIPSILCALLNIITNHIFIRIYGYQAAAYTTFGCYLVFCIVHYLFYRKVCKEVLGGKQLYNIKGIAGISLAVLFSGFILIFVNQILWLKYGIIVTVSTIVIVFRRKILRIVKTVFSRI